MATNGVHPSGSSPRNRLKAVPPQDDAVASTALCDLDFAEEPTNEHPLRKAQKAAHPGHSKQALSARGNISQLSAVANYPGPSIAAHSRHLITVIPPSYLPHDPPHPRTSSFCSGYGPASKFSRGVLVPLYPTLAGQIAAVAREYGLPSIAGIALYLLEISSDLIDTSIHKAFVGGPRIGEEAWQLLWERVFEAEAADQMSRAPFSDDEEFDESDSPYWSRRSNLPPVPPIPAHIHPHRLEEEISNPHSLSDNSSRNSDHLEQDDLIHEPETAGMYKSRNSELTKSPPAPQSRPGSAASRRYGKTMSTLSSTSYTRSTSRNYFPTRSARSTRTASIAGSSASAYSSSVIVGKVEFDIDQRRGAARWFDNWMEAASPNTLNASSNPPSPALTGTALLQQPAHERIPSLESVPEPRRQPPAQLAKQSNGPSHSRGASQKLELFLPSLVDARRSPHEPLQEAKSIPEGDEKPEETQQVEQREPEAATQASEGERPRSSSTPPVTSEEPASSRRTSMASELENPPASRSDSDDSEEEQATVELLGTDDSQYAPLVNHESDGSDYGDQDVASPTRGPSPEVPASAQSTAKVPQVSMFEPAPTSKSVDPKADPLADVFGHEASWSSFPIKELSTSNGSTGLGILTNNALSEPAQEDEGALSEQDDVKDVTDIMKARRGGMAQLSSPIHLEAARFESTVDGVSTEPDPPATSNFSMPEITHTSPSIHTSSRATSYISRSPDSSGSLFDLAAIPEHQVPQDRSWNRQSSQVGDSELDGTPTGREQAPTSTYADETDDDKTARYEAAIIQEPVDPNSETAAAVSQTPVQPTENVRQSTEMYDNIERALAELSPVPGRSFNAPRSPHFKRFGMSSPGPSPIQPSSPDPASSLNSTPVAAPAVSSYVAPPSRSIVDLSSSESTSSIYSAMSTEVPLPPSPLRESLDVPANGVVPSSPPRTSSLTSTAPEHLPFSSSASPSASPIALPVAPPASAPAYPPMTATSTPLLSDESSSLSYLNSPPDSEASEVAHPNFPFAPSAGAIPEESSYIPTALPFSPDRNFDKPLRSPDWHAFPPPAEAQAAHSDSTESASDRGSSQAGDTKGKFKIGKLFSNKSRSPSLSNLNSEEVAAVAAPMGSPTLSSSSGNKASFKFWKGKERDGPLSPTSPKPPTISSPTSAWSTEPIPDRSPRRVPPRTSSNNLRLDSIAQDVPSPRTLSSTSASTLVSRRRGMTVSAVNSAGPSSPELPELPGPVPSAV